LYIRGSLAASQGGKLFTIAGCSSIGNLGRGYNDNTHFAGDIAEVLVYNRALTESERVQVEDYLDRKYGNLRAQPESGVEGDIPALRVRLVAGELHLCWPTSSTDYVLEQSELTFPAHWSPVAQVPARQDENCLTLPAHAGSRFFRLRKP
jgi:hypothetical protein